MPVSGKRKSHKSIRRLLPHTAILIAVFVYTIGGGYIFYLLENPHSAKSDSTSSITSTIKTTFTSWNFRNNPSTLRNTTAPSLTEPDPVDHDPTVDSHCTQSSISTLIDTASRECLAAARNRANEFSAHYCANILGKLRQCVHKSSFPLDIPKTSPTPRIHKQCESVDSREHLTVSNYIFMAFTIISTVGYGHVAPVTIGGRIFCIVYGLFGIPLALLAIADQGRFLSGAIMHVYKKTRSALKRCCRRGVPGSPASVQSEGNSEEESMPAFLLLIVFFIYMVIGGVLLTPYESQWSYVDAVYFTFISSSSIGFGDLVPEEGPYLPITVFYVALGLALSTAAIDVFAGYLRKLHHWGKKIRNCANKLIWFGGKHVTLTQLVKSIGVQLGVPEEKITHLMEHFDEVVTTTIEHVERGGAALAPVEAPLLKEEKEEIGEKPKTLGEGIDFIDDRDQVQANVEDEFDA